MLGQSSCGAGAEVFDDAESQGGDWGEAEALRLVAHF
eukprot:SAG11_NODE_27571_length_331_cov_0.866379_1_plen_36_part_10